MQVIDRSSPDEPQALSTKIKPGGSPRFYTAGSLFQLFSVCAFPIHLWSLVMAFRDLAWVSARTSLWDGLGLISYALFVALFETLVCFAFLLLLGFLVPASWQMEKRLALPATHFLVLACWSILLKVFGLFGSPFPPAFLRFVASSGHPLWVLWGIILPLAVISMVLPFISILRSADLARRLAGFFDRLTVLAAFYLILDVAALVIILIRNIAPRVGN